MSWPGRRRLSTRDVAVACFLVSSLALAGCGSNLDPMAVDAAQGAAPGEDAGTVANGALLPEAVEVEGAQPIAGVGGGGADPGATTPTPGVGVSGPDLEPGAPQASEAPVADSDGGSNTEGSSTPTGGVQAASCEGLASDTGISDDTIVIGNASDISGPIPGLFQQTQDAVEAYVAYFNATSDICGRKLEVRTYDSRTDATADQQVYAAACDEVFAMVGSASAFDSGGAATAQACGLPDLRANSLTRSRNACATCFGANSTNARQFENIVPDTIIDDYTGGEAGAMLYINAGAAAENGKTQSEVGAARGIDYVYESGIELAEFNYVPYVQQMKDRGVRSLQFIANESIFIRMAQTMQQQGFSPEVVMLDPSAYTPLFVQNGGDAVEGTVVFLNFTPFEEAATNAELRLYLSWLDQVHPGTAPGFFGVFAWSAARLFVETAVGLGGSLDRASLVEAVRKVDDWTANGLHAAQRVGSKQVSDCWRFIRLVDGRWIPEGGRTYRCAGVTTVD